MTQILIADIKVGRRHRKELGDLTELAASMAELGLLHPIVITPKRQLIAGERRLEAAKLLGWTKVPTTEIDLVKVVEGEYAENAFRKNLTPSECVDIADAIAPVQRAEAKKRQGTRTDLGAKLPQSSPGKARDKVARVAGIGHTSLDKARAVRDAAKANPERFGKLQADMDRTGRINGPHRRLKVIQQGDAIRKEPPPLPGKGPYRVIVADPPWPYEIRQEDPSHRAVLDYPTMTIEKICALDVATVAHADCILWLWTTNHHMRQAYAVLDAWGFEAKTILTWAKDKFGAGDWLRGQTEHAIMAVRGKPTVTLTNQSTLLLAPRPPGSHSQKPDAFYAFVEKLCPAPRYASLFHRGPTRPNWDGHGDEVGVVNDKSTEDAEVL
jgi:N6-adenosine-specific RNA methylase IME4